MLKLLAHAAPGQVRDQLSVALVKLEHDRERLVVERKILNRKLAAHRAADTPALECH